MTGWHHWLYGRESQWTSGVGDGQGGLACCDSWGRKESDTNERLIWSDLIWPIRNYSWKTVDWSGGPVVKSPCFQCRGHRFHPWLGNYDPACHMVQPKIKTLVINLKIAIYTFCRLTSNIFIKSLTEQHRNLVRRVFANFFNAWFNRLYLESLTCCYNTLFCNMFWLRVHEENPGTMWIFCVGIPQSSWDHTLQPAFSMQVSLSPWLPPVWWRLVDLSSLLLSAFPPIFHFCFCYFSLHSSPV